MIEKNVTDELFLKITDYVFDTSIQRESALKTAYIALLDSMACAAMALKVPMCRALLGPIVPGTKIANGARVPGTSFELDPIKAAFDIGTCIRWLDFNDTWLAKEWGHPSDNLGSILAVGDYLNRSKKSQYLTVEDVLHAMIKAYEIQGVLALENSFNQIGLDHVILVKIASAAVISKWMGFNKFEACDLLSQVIIDGHSLRTYRHAPNTGPRKSWAAGDATSRAVFLAWLVKHGQPGYPSAISATHWGFSDVLFHGKPISLEKSLGSYVMENILFKVAYPAEFHAQTAVECSFRLHPEVVHRLQYIDHIDIKTQQSAIRIIDKTGPLHNYADRDHCIQYMVAIGLLHGDLRAAHYTDETAKDPRIDELRSKMIVSENLDFSKDYLDPDKRSIANSIQVFFNDGSSTKNVVVEYPLGHKSRRLEALPHLQNKYENAIATLYSAEQKDKLLALWQAEDKVLRQSLSDFMGLFVKS